MKKILLNLFVIAGLLLITTSCDDDYLEVYPNHAVAEADVFATTTNAWGAINGIHRFIYQQGGNMDQAGQTAQMIFNDHLGDDLVLTANQWFMAGQRWLAHVNENNNHVWHRYRFYYQVIANANQIIVNIDAADGPQADKDIIKGQALAYRAWAHFELVQFYADRFDWTAANNSQLGVPLVLEPTTEGLPRSTVDEVYAQVRLDLEESINLLDGRGRRNNSHIDEYVARGIRARVALASGEWNVAASMANAVRSQYGNLLNHEQMLTGFNNRTLPESIWASHVIPDHTTYFHSFFAFMSFNFSSTNIRSAPKAINSNLYDMISDTDIRKQWFEETSDEARARLTANNLPRPGAPAYGAVNYHSFKFQAVDAGDSRGDVTYMRTAEIFLIEAEALARDGQYGTAAQVLYDLISTRDDDYVLSTNTGQDLLDEIWVHRRIELWGEGFRFQDLKRTNSDLDRRNSNFTDGLHIMLYYPAGGPEWTSLIPLDEINANPNIVQNQH